SVFGGVRGPFSMLLHSPKLAERVLGLVTFFRDETVTEPNLRSVAILAAVREREAAYVWSAQVGAARRNGDSEERIDPLRATGGACRRARPRRAGSVTRSPESQLFELRTGRGGPTTPPRRSRTLRHPPVLRRRRSYRPKRAAYAYAIIERSGHGFRGGDLLHGLFDGAGGARPGARGARVRVAVGAGALAHPAVAPFAVSAGRRPAQEVLRRD